MGKADGPPTRVILSGRPGDDDDCVAVAAAAAEKRRGVVAAVLEIAGALVATPLTSNRTAEADMIPSSCNCDESIYFSSLFVQLSIIGVLCFEL